MNTKKMTLGLVLTVGLLGIAGCGGPEADSASDLPAPQSSSSAPSDTSPPSEGESKMPEAPASESPAADVPDAPEEVVITVEGFAFDGPTTVSPGATITIVNKDVVPHTVTSEEEGVFDVLFDGGETVTFTAPEEPGEYPYICTLHPAMKGILVVE